MGSEPHAVAPDKATLSRASPTLMDAATRWRNHPAAKLHRISTPEWRHRGEQNLPLLATPQSVESPGPLDFPGTNPDGAMDTFAYETRPGSAVKYVGVATLKGKVPDAYLIYFRHSVKEKDFRGEHTLLETGVGDYLIGRMQVCRQVLRSGKNVAVVVPVAMGGAGEFALDPGFVEQCVSDIRDDLFPTAPASPPLLLACNSDGIKELNLFLTNCRRLVGRVKAVYDFDGSFVIAASGVTLAGLGSAKVFRYNQGPSVPAAGPGLGSNPVHVPLPFERWSRHFNYAPDWPRELADPKGAEGTTPQADPELHAPLHPDLHAAPRAGEHTRHLTADVAVDLLNDFLAVGEGHPPDCRCGSCSRCFDDGPRPGPPGGKRYRFG